VWTAGWDKTILVWNWATHTFVKTMDVRHEDAISVLVWVGKVGAAREDLLISGSWDGRIILWSSSAEEGEKSKAPVRVSKSVSDHWQPVVLGQNVADHWGVTSPPRSNSLPNSPPDEGMVDTIGRGLRLLGKSPSRNTMSVLPPMEASPSSPRLSANSSPSMSNHLTSVSTGALRQVRRPVSSHEGISSKARATSCDGRK
jgi:WD40 repeat protein